VAALLGGQSVDTIIINSKARFRYVKLSQISKEDMHSQGAHVGLGHGERTESVDHVASKARMGQVDAFLSHSWYDDLEQKWEALQRWAKNFEREQGREPTLWIDKFCIDQSDISAELPCLPIFLASCRKLLVLQGDTYLSRLWCVVEIYMYIVMGGSPDDIIHIDIMNADRPTKPSVDKVHMASPRPSKLSESACPRQAARQSIDSFASANCSCFLAEDKTRMLIFIENGFGSTEEFDGRVRSLLDRVVVDVDEVGV
jgi:hypothetical protein